MPQNPQGHQSELNVSAPVLWLLWTGSFFVLGSALSMAIHPATAVASTPGASDTSPLATAYRILQTCPKVGTDVETITQA